MNKLVRAARGFGKELRAGVAEPVLLLDRDGSPWWEFPDGSRMRPIAGGADLPAFHPLGPPTVSGNNITVDMMLNQPTRITRMIMDLSLQRFIVDRIFNSAGGVAGGALIYDQVQANELYTDEAGGRKIERVAPGSEFPIVSSTRLAPKIAEVEKYGGKVFVTDEARERNDSAAMTNQIRQLTNTIIKKINTRGIAELVVQLDALGGAADVPGNDWSSVVTGGAGQDSNEDWPAADFAKVQLVADTEELGVVYNIWLVNPQEMANFRIVYGDKFAAVLAANGIDEMYASNRVTAGTAFAVAEGQVGEMRVEKPLGTETWREQSTERTWVQASVRPLFAVTNPLAVKRVTGLAGA